MDTPSYYAIRLCPHARSTVWWAGAERVGAAAPPAFRALLTGRSRVEVTAVEAEHLLEWARTLDGWADALPPLRIYPEPVV